MPEIQLKLSNLIETASSESYAPPSYEKLTEKYGFHDGGVWIKKKIREIYVNCMFSGLPIAEIRTTLKRFAKIRFDLDGLKTVNDIGSHRLGDILLDSVAGVFRNQVISSFCEQYSISFEVDRAGGDEFDLLIERSNGSLDEIVQCEMLGKTIQHPLCFALRDLVIIEVSRIPFRHLEFHCKEVHRKLGDYGRELLVRAEKALNDRRFYFTPSVTAGEALFWDILVRFLKKPDLKEKLSQFMISEILMGMVEDISGDLLVERKVMLKEELWKSTCPTDNLQALLLTRGKADQESAIRMHKLGIANRLRMAVSEELYALEELKFCLLKENADYSRPELLAEIMELDECIVFLRNKILGFDSEVGHLLKSRYN